jgi:hypothetical protein
MLRASIMSVAWLGLVFPASSFELVVVNETNSSVLQKTLHRACKHAELER